MATTTDPAALHALQPDPLDARTEDVLAYVEALQDGAQADPELARREAWAQIRLAGERARSHPAEAQRTLHEIFRAGSPPDPALEGFHPGILVATTIVRPVDSGARALAGAWMPWLGKRFDAQAQTGDNVLVPGARPLMRVLWPGYQPQDAGEGRLAAFRFRTYVEAGRVDPDRDVMKIDYDSEENPRLGIRDILDELVQVVPGAYLGKILLRRGGGWDLIGYFALRSPGH